MLTKNPLREQVKGLNASPADYLPLARQIERGDFPELRPMRVAVLGAFTMDPLGPYTVVESANLGLACDLYVAPYNQIEQLVLDSKSPLYQFEPEVIILALRLEDIATPLSNQLLETTESEAQLAQVSDRFQILLHQIRDRTAATLLVWNFPDIAYLATGLADASSEFSQTATIQRANEELARICRQVSSAYVFDLRRLATEIGLDRWFDPKLYFYARIPFSVPAQRQIGRSLARFFHALSFPPRKCLVLDLDNVLWGGVVGEDGLGGIDLGEDYPGNVYKDFHRHLLTLRSRGILLAIASKNNWADAQEVFENHPDCLLQLSHFTSAQIGWQDKATSLRTIADELNIGIDSLAFFDDSPVERELVRSQLPEVLVVDVPDNPLGYTSALSECAAFDYLSISDEDLQRADLYRQDHHRQQLEQTSHSVADFLRQLDMKAVCGFVGSDTLPRVSQLMAKTNQLNVTTRRYTAGELLKMRDGGAVSIWLRLSDRFGDNGLVGVAIATPTTTTKEQWLVDSLVLSCRVIGRQAEGLLLSQLSNLIEQRGGSELIGEFLPTAKNAPAAAIFSDCGFEALDEAGHRWRWDLAKGPIPKPDFIHVEFQEKMNG
jgi:FkbH-like protein